jgi:hypothetical protein
MQERLTERQRKMEEVQRRRVRALPQNPALQRRKLLRQARLLHRSNSEGLFRRSSPVGICRLHGKLARVLKGVDEIDGFVASNRLNSRETKCESTGVTSAGLN